MKISSKKLAIFVSLALSLLVPLFIVALEMLTRANRAHQFDPIGGRSTLPCEEIRFLPDHVVAAQGELSLYADYDAAIDGVITLYLVNRTDTSIDIFRHDEDLYVRRYRQSSDGSWERAQTFRHSGCGNSSNVAAIPAGTFYKFRTMFSTREDAKPSTVRFQFANDRDLASNIGIGAVSDEEVEEASYDDMALWQAKWPQYGSHLSGYVHVLSNESSYDRKQRLMAWRMIRETLYGTYDGNSFSCPGEGRMIGRINRNLEPEDKIKLNEVALQVIQGGQSKEREFAAAVLAADPLSNLAILQSLVHDKQEAVWKWAALGLVNADDRQYLVKACEARSDEEVVDAVWILSEFRSTSRADEKLLWDRVADSNPPAFAHCYRFHNIIESELSILPYRERLIDCLKNESESPNTSITHLQESRLYYLIGLVGAWQRKEDVELLERFRNHPKVSIREIVKSRMDEISK